MVQSVFMYVLYLDKLEPVPVSDLKGVWLSSVAGLEFMFRHPFLISFGALLYWLYYAAAESSRRQATLGKWAVGMQVTDLRGQRLSFWRASLRHLCKVISVAPFLLGVAHGFL